MASWTTPTDVIGPWIGEDAPDDEDKVQLWIDKAEREIRRKVMDIQSRIDAEAAEVPAREDLLRNAVDVTVAMVTRVFRNPEGIRQANMTAGSYTESRTYGGDVPGGLALTDDELEKLRGVIGGAFTISMVPATSPFYRG